MSLISPYRHTQAEPHTDIPALSCITFPGGITGASWTLVTMPTKGSFLSANPSLCPIAAAHRVCALILVFTGGRSAILRAGHTQTLSHGENDSLALGQVEEHRDSVGYGENPPGVVRRNGGRGCVSKDWSGWWALVVT